MGKWLFIKEAALASIAFVRQHDLDAYEICCADQHLDKASMREEDEVLIRAPPQFDLLLPASVPANNQHPNAMLGQVVKNAAAGSTRIAVQLPLPLISEDIEPVRGGLAFR
jgi:hypothetical protein